MINLKNKKIMVTGASGFLGTWVVQKLLEKGVPKGNILSPRSSEFDLRKLEDCEKAVSGLDVVIHVAALTGNREFHRKNPAVIFYDNLIMGAQLMEAARLSNVKKFIGIGSAFEYPEAAKLPYNENDLWNGLPEEDFNAYALAKRMLVVQGSAYRKQYGFDSIHLILPNMFGPGEKKDSGYVIPSLIRRVVEAKKKGEDLIEMWGTGESTREFLYVEDAADGIILATEKYDKPDPVNLGSGIETHIRDLANIILDIMEFKGAIRWNDSKSENRKRCILDIKKARAEFGFLQQTDLKEGLRKTVDWHLKAL